MFDAGLLPGVLASAPDAMVVVDAAGIVRYANLRLTTLFGYLTDEVIGQRVEMLLPDHARERHVGHRQGFQRTLHPRPMGVGQELFARRKDGTEFPVEISLSPIGGGNQPLVAAAIRDATERRAAENELRKARAEADRANLAKSRFLAAASHDLRQPLQALALLNGTLRRNITEPAMLDIIEEQRQAIATATRLLSALLDISKLESGSVAVEMTDFDLGSALEELRDEFRVIAEDKGLTIRIDSVRVRARTDRTLVLQAVRNLVANALKYTDQGTITLRCWQDTAAYVEVADTGIGMHPDQMSAIFDEFFQIGSATHTSRQGYGLGLSIVDRIVRLLGLEIAVQSEPGKGSKFTLTLPPGTNATAEADSVIGRRGIQALARNERRILLVEDDPAVRKATRAFLRSEGYLVTVAASLAEALQVTEQMDTIDLVISDYHLEGARGTAVIAALRSKYGEQLASILMTGDTSSAIKELPRDNQLRIISKPVDAEELLELVEALMPASLS